MTTDRIHTATCATCGHAAPVDGPHYCADERREVLADVATGAIFTDLARPLPVAEWATA